MSIQSPLSLVPVILLVIVMLPTQHVSAQEARVSRLLKKKDYSKLGQLAKSLVDAHDDYGYYIRGEISYQQKRFKQAVFHYKRSAQSEAHKAISFYSIGFSFLNQDEYDSAINYLQKYLDTGHGRFDASVCKYISVAYFQQNDLAKAQEYAVKSILADQTNQDYYFWAAQMYDEEMKMDFACMLYQKAIERGNEKAQKRFWQCNCESWESTWIQKQGILIEEK